MTLSAPARPAAAPLWVPPRHAASRDPYRRTLGPAVAKVAQLLGRPLMPWQRYVADVAGEVDDAGRPVHPFVVVTVPRQSGKTTLDLATSVQRCLYRPNQRVWHTAQTGQDARGGWRDFCAELMQTPLRELVAELRRGNGQEVLRFVNGSTFRPHPPTHDSLHGKQSDLANIDEGWSFDEAQGAALLQAIAPTQLTRPGAQTFVWSTMGDAGSTWFHDLVDRGRAGEFPIFDWGIPDGEDPDDDDVITRWHPAVGHTATPESLLAARVSMPNPAQYARAYGNRRTGGRERIIPEPLWEAARAPDGDRLPPGTPAYGVAVYEPRDGGDVSGALYAAVPDADGRPWLELVETRPGRAWLVDRVLELNDRGAGVAVDRRGPSGPVADALELAGVELLIPAGADWPSACGDFWDRLCDDEARADRPRLVHRTAVALDVALDLAGRRWVAAGSWVWDDERSTGDIACLKAATLAAWAAARPPEAPIVVGRSVFS